MINTNTTSTPVLMALPSKGAIAEPTINFLKECGLRIDKPNQRQYTGTVPAISTLSVLFQRVTDILYKVADGSVHLGITGLDVVEEHPHRDVIVIHRKLGFGHCQLVVAVPESWIDVNYMVDLADVALDFREYQGRNMRIATKYPTLARQFLYRNNIHHFTLVQAEGAVEAAPLLGYADIIIDLTQTGTTLRENHLKIINDGVIVDSQASLIGNRKLLISQPDSLGVVRQLVEYIDAAQLGRGYHQITANICGTSAEAVALQAASHPLTRGLQGPTVGPILGGEENSETSTRWFTVTIMVPSESLLMAVDHLRAVGGTQTIVSPIRYVFLQESPTFRDLTRNLQKV